MFDKEVLWRIKLDGEPWIDNSNILSNDLYLIVNTATLKYDLNKIDLKTGEVKWSIKNVDSTTHILSDSIIQVYGQQLNIYNIMTGQIEKEIEFKELKSLDIRISGNLTVSEGTTLYFTSYTGTGADKKAVLGSVNLMSNKIELFDIPFDKSEVDMRSPIGRPFVNKENIFIEVGKTLRKYSLK